jgi:phosphoribosylformimino-5-aminoimidazole carboxamide ribotide isomerase
MRIIPAIDIIDGKCVRLTQGDYSQKKIYNENPLAVARQFQQAGLRYLHLVDLDGAKAGKVMNWKIIEAIASKTDLQIDFGGGIKTDDDIKNIFEAGIQQVNLGSIAVKDKNKVLEWLATYGDEKIILSADVKNETIAIHGWQDTSSLNIFDFVGDYLKAGVRYVVCTDIGTDGTLAGPSIDLYSRILKEQPMMKLVASGGVGNIDDLKKLKAINVHGVIIGKAIYEGRVTLKELISI